MKYTLILIYLCCPTKCLYCNVFFVQTLFMMKNCYNIAINLQNDQLRISFWLSNWIEYTPRFVFEICFWSNLLLTYFKKYLINSIYLRMVSQSTRAMANTNSRKLDVNNLWLSRRLQYILRVKYLYIS